MSFIINNKKIKQISGPVSLHILKPDLSFYNHFKEEYNIHTPIFILFGDIHDSKKYQCKTCKYDINKKSYCYHVYDKEFLQLLDNMSEQKYPIDFFIEGFVHLEKKMILNKNEIDEPIPMLRERLHTCYKRELRGTKKYLKECPTKNIRWHSADTRQSEKSKYNFEEVIDYFYEEILEELIGKKITEKSLTKILNNYSNRFNKKDIINYLSAYSYIFSSPEEFAEQYIYNDSVKNKSLVIKQIHKMKDTNLIQTWYKWIEEYINYVISNSDKEIMKEEGKKIFIQSKELGIELVQFFIQYFSSKTEESKKLLLIKFVQYLNSVKKIDSQLQIFSDLMLNYNDIFLDLYMLGRTFKNPHRSINSFINISYFGDSHIDHIKYFLTNIIGKYDVVFSKNERNEQRCVQSKKTVDIDKLIEEYKIKKELKNPKRSYKKRSYKKRSYK